MREDVDGAGRRSEGAQPRPMEPAGAGDHSTTVDLALLLRDTTANLAAHIEKRAEEIAAPRIAAVQEAAEAEIADVEAERDLIKQRLGDLAEELRRHLAAQDRRIADLAWVARYLPYRLRLYVGLGDRHRGDRPKESFAAAVDQVAAELGLVPYAKEQPATPAEQERRDQRQDEGEK